MHTYRNFPVDNLEVFIGSNSINFIDEGSYLGITIDKKLKYKTHIRNICNKLAKASGVIYKLRSLNASKAILTQVYYSVAYPYLNYSVCTYAGTYDCYLDRIFLLQKRLVRIISNADFYAHTDNLFFRAKILKIYDIYKLNIGIYMYENRNLNLYERTHSYHTRNRNNLMPTRGRLTVTNNSISTVGPNIWNNIPEEIRNLPSRDSFKFHYKNWLLSSYAEINGD